MGESSIPGGDGATTPTSAEAVCALLDDGMAPRDEAASRLYTGFRAQLRCTDPSQLAAFWPQVQAAQQQGLHAVLLADYEWGARLLGAGLGRALPAAVAADAPALQVLLFDRVEALNAQQVEAWLQAQPDAAGVAGTLDITRSVTREAFTEAIGAIQAAIAAGETYQVNYTYRCHGQAYGAPLALYRRLRARQAVAFGAYIVLPPGGPHTHVLSRSPELFVRARDGLATTRPMKGTAARQRPIEGDSETARLLQADIKNRAENLMIVDLLRNDLGRIAETGSVQVPQLFTIESYATVFQMTSTVTARLRPDTDGPALLRALFPCGSITGAPKLHTMDLIAQFESTPRGLYCGSIGWLDAPPPGRALGDFCFNVAIRTLTLGPEDAQGLRRLSFGVGAGIVQDSQADDEFAECQWKARFVTALDPGFALFETLRVEADGRILLLERHLKRLRDSAQRLGFQFDEARALGLLKGAAAAASHAMGVRRLRLELRRDGHLELREAALAPLPATAFDAQGRVRLRWADEGLPRARPLSAHKTTDRVAYDRGVAQAEAAGVFDSLFLREDGVVVEGGRSTLFYQWQGRWWTPPLADGALAGVARAQWLAEDPTAAGERRLLREELGQVTGWRVGNALRGVMDAAVEGPLPVWTGSGTPSA